MPRVWAPLLHRDLLSPWARSSRPSALNHQAGLQPPCRASQPSCRPGCAHNLLGPACHVLAVQLVQRFYDPQRGTIFLDGVPLPQIDNVYLHQSVALVAQEPLVFADTIKANILFGVHRTNVPQVNVTDIGPSVPRIKERERVVTKSSPCHSCSQSVLLVACKAGAPCTSYLV